MAEFKITGPDTPSEPEVKEPEFHSLPEEHEDAPTSLATPLRSLKARRAALLEGLYFDYQVPRYSDPSIYIRFRPVVAKTSNELIKKRETQGKKDEKIDWQVLANADLIASFTEGIYVVWPDQPDVKESVDGGDDWSKFDHRTAIALGVETEATFPDQLVRKLFFTDGDLFAAANALLAWSNGTNDKVDADFS